MRSLVVAVAQPSTIPLDIVRNVATHAAVVRAAAARVVVFPELSLTGYQLDATTIDEHDPRLAPLIDACAATDTIALAGAPLAGPHIATLAIDAGGARIVYRKQYPHHTEARFQPGPAPARTSRRWRSTRTGPGSPTASSTRTTPRHGSSRGPRRPC